MSEMQTTYLTPKGIDMQYKSLICDVDGTLIPNKQGAILSDKVKFAITRASAKVHVGVATSRPIFLLQDVIKTLKLSGPSVINAGAEIVDLSTGNVLIKHLILKADYIFLIEKLKEYDLNIRLDDGKHDIAYEERGQYEHIMKVFALGVKEEMVDELIREISHISTLVAHKVPHFEEGTFDIFFTHSLATKQHGILEIAKILNISTHEIIGIGDGHNDFPLLMACGLKIAMGNAVDDLKAIADYIAPPAEEDGVVDAIEKFVLREK